MISLDAGHLKYELWCKYQLMIVSSTDGENRNILLAFSLVPTEDGEIFIWMIKQMIEHEKLFDTTPTRNYK